MYFNNYSYYRTEQEFINNLSKSIIDSNNSFNQYNKIIKKTNKNSLVPNKFILSVILVENRERPIIWQKSEEILAKSSFILTKKIPDMSFGVGQIKLSTAKSVLTKEKKINSQTDISILNKLLSEEENIKMMSNYFKQIMNEQKFSYFDREKGLKILCIYHGYEINSLSCPGFYEKLVWNIYTILNEKELDF
ncbi:hypothetical protein [Crocosphaera sp.]|uniref:hypothetical protein n=1 Tax=Crocosphaera sp. TaxID=2729996 RepID=UPI003F26039A